MGRRGSQIWIKITIKPITIKDPNNIRILLAFSPRIERGIFQAIEIITKNMAIAALYDHCITIRLFDKREEDKKSR